MMKARVFALSALVILAGSLPGHADYKRLVTTWDAWTPPVYAEGPGSNRDRKPDTVPGEGGQEAASGHEIWAAKATGLLELGRFIRTMPGSQTSWTVEQAQAGIGSVLRLADIEQIVISRNPAVLSAAEAFRAELHGFDQVGDLDAVLSRYAAFTSGVMTGVGPKGAGMDQPFPFPAGSALKSRIVYQNAALAAINLNITIRDKITAARKAFWNLELVHEKRTILTETLDLTDHLHDIASTMYKTGRTSYQDVIQISIRKKVLENQIGTLREKQRAVESALLALLDLPGETRLARPDTGRQDLGLPGAPSLVTRALEMRQELLRLDHGITKMELMIEMAESMVLPPLDTGLSDKRSDINTAGTWAGKEAFPDQPPPAAMGAGQPKKPWFGTSESWLAQTRKKLSAMRHQRQDLYAMTGASVQSAWFNLDDAVRTYRLYKTSIIELSASALDVSTKEYESGRVSFAETAGAYTHWLDARLASATAKRDAGIYRADLQRTVGVSF